MKKNQLILIKGGSVFASKEDFYNYLRQVEYNPYKKRKKWSEWLKNELCESFDFFEPLMPNKRWADYEAWKIWFDRVLEFVDKGVSSKLVLAGQSLGAGFLLKHLSQNNLLKKVDQLHLVSTAYKDNDKTGEKIGNFEVDLTKLEEVERQVKQIFMYHSKDDKTVPFEDGLYLKKYFKKVEFLEFEDRGHFSQAIFLELLEEIKRV
ncbi:hypothetical protein DRH14_00250 [Candidatus Shapirobacteria bacterium]|nr:MAG: hypothetical protein DRH14_00250 [Candidatus Shapirobacteria bacterium]